MLLPVWMAAISISGITRLPVVLATTSLNRATSKIWMDVVVDILSVGVLDLEFEVTLGVILPTVIILMCV